MCVCVHCCSHFSQCRLARVSFYDAGYADGHTHGRLHGLIEGRALGRDKGYELWEEIGFYEGFAKFWQQTARASDRFAVSSSYHTFLIPPVVALNPTFATSSTSLASSQQQTRMPMTRSTLLSCSTRSAPVTKRRVPLSACSSSLRVSRATLRRRRRSPPIDVGDHTPLRPTLAVRHYAVICH